MDFYRDDPGEYVLEDPQKILQLPLNRIHERFENDDNWELDHHGLEVKATHSSEDDRTIWIDYGNDLIVYNLGSEVEELEEGTVSLLEDHPKSSFLEDELKAYLLPEWREKKYLKEQMPKHVKDSSVDTYDPISLDEIIQVLVPDSDC